LTHLAILGSYEVTGPKPDNPTTKERFFELLKQYPENKLVEFAEILDSEGFKNEHGNKIGTGTLSKWRSKMG